MWATAHGRDDRPVEPPKHRKSVGAECNWGIRFTCDADALTFLDQQAVELSSRMHGRPEAAFTWCWQARVADDLTSRM